MNPYSDILSGTTPVRLAAGGHFSPQEGLCIMEICCIASGQKSFTALPECTHDGIARVAQRVWDSAPEAEHPALVRKFLTRLLRARKSGSIDVERRLALWCARRVEHLGPPEAKACNDVTERYLRGEATWDELLAAANAANAAYAANAANAAYAALEDFLDALLDQYEKLLADTPEGIYIPAPWEDEAMAFVESLMAEDVSAVSTAG